MTEVNVTAAEKRTILSALAVVMLLSALDQTIVSTAMPRIIEQLHGLSMYAWVTTAGAQSIFMQLTCAVGADMGWTEERCYFGRKTPAMCTPGFTFSGYRPGRQPGTAPESKAAARVSRRL